MTVGTGVPDTYSRTRAGDDNGDDNEEKVESQDGESVYFTEEDLLTFTQHMQKEGLMAGGEIFIKDLSKLEGSDFTPDHSPTKNQEEYRYSNTEQQ